MSFGKRLKAVIKEERYSQREFAEILGIPLRSLENYLSDKQRPRLDGVLEMLQRPELEKYTLWLMTGKTNPEAGQVCPAFSTQEQCGLVQEDSQKQA
ncbi:MULTISPECIES: helix-turn-helix domain-containing protein [unclassified Vibrio]|uniref:helix-turn-helix domain-containing protein n=1 Tax=unclassified Vibrio TaxID=2614977 RepID=UPI001361BCFD|nr:MULTISPECIES: helix-turn-helix transcriptional regulator [unclassified Vibrio]NAW59626.1 transcriptional regulator [Vibrio sp. V36_P2S2PM302]NAX23803.1 transcriptional regulator [Vibrio sp. V39_P1S14PM300]NAX25034.1 transcriptional regulator [Vibrio sp. V38_P2S17PM301]NAX29302.1 transcriptional regulator [Vibrio sp. V37_P2S8PM304]